MTVRESVIEKYLKKKVREKGGSTRKIKWIGRKGAPDRLVLLPGRYFLAELKRPGKGAEAHQKREHDKLVSSGLIVFVLNTKEKIDKVLP